MQIRCIFGVCVEQFLFRMPSSFYHYGNKTFNRDNTLFVIINLFLYFTVTEKLVHCIHHSCLCSPIWYNILWNLCIWRTAVLGWAESLRETSLESHKSWNYHRNCLRKIEIIEKNHDSVSYRNLIVFKFDLDWTSSGYTN